jgi:hypothetical protein
MTKRTSRSDHPARPDHAAGPGEAFGGGALWIGQHTGDHDILVLDPEESDSTADVLALYSLTQHRTRRFPRATVANRIHLVTDELAHTRATENYAQRAALRENHERTSETVRAERLDRIREGMIATHQRYVEILGLEYQGVNKTGEAKVGRASKCHACALPLDDFVGASCAICSTVLCSCGACSCGKPARARRNAAATADVVDATDAE